MSYRLKSKKIEVETVVALVDQRRVELQLEASLLGRRIYAEKPRRFARRLKSYWRAWLAESKAEPKEVCGLSLLLLAISGTRPDSVSMLLSWRVLWISCQDR